MKYFFYAYGHPNILGTHKTTLEFTKDSHLSLKGDCVVGVNSDFELSKIKEFIKASKSKKIEIEIKAISPSIKSASTKIREAISAEINPNFSSRKELVIRKGDFLSERTFAINADKAAFQLGRKLIGFLGIKGNKVVVRVF